MGTRLKNKELFEAILATVFSLIGLGLMAYHYITFGG
jgi:hypothetical protein